MKRLYYLLLVLPLLAVMASCSDDDKDLPKVNISVQYSGASEQDGVITVAQGETLTIDAIDITPVSGTGKAVLGNTTYYLDGVPFYTIGVAPYSGEIDTTGIPEGEHSLSFMSQVFQVDREPGFALYGVTLMITPPTDNPDSGSGTVTPEVTVSGN